MNFIFYWIIFVINFVGISESASTLKTDEMNFIVQNKTDQSLTTDVTNETFSTSAFDTKMYNFQCFSTDELALQKKFYTAKRKRPIILQVSHRATHQLSSRIFAIIAREFLGYQNVEIVNMRKYSKYALANEESKLYETLLDLQPQSNTDWPNVTLDMEVWMEVDYFAVPYQITAAGLVTKPGRFGWFVHKNLTAKLSYAHKKDYLQFGVFQMPNISAFRNFVVDENLINHIKTKFGNSEMEEYIPEKCEFSLCATFFAQYKNDTSFIKHNIQYENLYVKVLWLADSFKESVNFLHNYYEHIEKGTEKMFVLLHWTPSDVILPFHRYDLITMPLCEQMITKSEESGTLCKYELTPLLKHYATKLKTETQAFDLIEGFELKPKHLQEMLENFNEMTKNVGGGRISPETYNHVACGWVRRNIQGWTQWLQESTGEIVIGGIFPKTGFGEAYKGITEVSRNAVHDINKDATILPNGLKVRIEETNGECRSDSVMKMFIYFFNLQTSLMGVLGPACSETVEPIAGITKYTRMTIISYSAEQELRDRTSYPYVFRTIGSNSQYEDVFLALFKQFKWKRVAALTEDGQKYTEYITQMDTSLKADDITMLVNQKFPKDSSPEHMAKILSNLKEKNAYIIIADIFNDNAQMVMCEAFKLKMTAYHGYVWFLPAWLSKSWMKESKIIKRDDVNCTTEELSKAINGHFSLSHSPYADSSAPMQTNITVGEWRNKYVTKNITDYAGFAYDAVWVYALATGQLLRENPDALTDLRAPGVIRRLEQIIRETDFLGVSGRIRFNRWGSRITDVRVQQWQNGNTVEIGRFVPAISETEFSAKGGKLTLNESAIQWLSQNRIPTDGRFVCDLQPLAELFNMSCEAVKYLFIALGCLFFVMLVSTASFIFWKRRYDMKLKQSAKVMRNFGIDLLSPSSNMSNNTLDKWEIPRERVVVNRVLGQGAFGTVYGGEAQINDEGWTAVAVKTLKVGASTEDRLDFLSEAEAMKRFDHKNIVKLLAVCLQKEPIYTIMEFMLHGDLKTFLLGRRHLVHEKVTDDSDICPKRLTMMALDIARGLSYLANRKYVHRDIASRNCLVNAQRVVKLGDFGMARPMFENDYYRFNRKGLLPVRWMAPESLGLSVFTPASDVWSFGILLYEIITFGSFPYQGLTNREVLEYIKSGNTLEIPAGTKPHLEGLMKACWHREFKSRPSATEIVEYISNYPRLLTPCLDVPLSSVQMPENESDQLELLPRLRKRTSTQPNIDILATAGNINNFDQKGYKIVDIGTSTSTDNICLHNLNVPPDSGSNDENSINSYSQMEPLLNRQLQFQNDEISTSNRYVPMCNNSNKISSPILQSNNITKNGTSPSKYNNNQTKIDRNTSDIEIPNCKFMELAIKT